MRDQRVFVRRLRIARPNTPIEIPNTAPPTSPPLGIAHPDDALVSGAWTHDRVGASHTNPAAH
jgi:hypothetical protein